MHARLYHTRFFCLWLTALVLALPDLTRAQAPLPTPDLLAGIAVQVIDQRQVTYGAHTVTLNRIAPPVFPPATPASRAGATPRKPQTRGATRSGPADDAGDGGAKAFQVVFLSATVYDHQFTLLRFYDGASPDLSVYVDLDCNLFTGVEQIETDDTIYLILLGLGNDTAASLGQAGQTPPNLPAFPQGYSAYQIIAGDPAAHADDVAALEALCAYHDANQAQMTANYNQQQAATAAYQQWQQAHPPVQPNTVIDFWPIQSRVYDHP